MRGLFLGFLFGSIGVCVFLCQFPTVLIAIAGNVMPPALFFGDVFDCCDRRVLLAFCG